MPFDRKFSLEGNTATTQHETGEYRITLKVERNDGNPIGEGEAELVLTKTMPLMFNQKISFGSR
jgi:hypothetical protein